MRDKANRLVYPVNEIQQYFMYGLMSDIHIDSKDFNKKKFESDANFIATQDGKILMFGDIMDLILSGDRKRHTQGSDQFNVDDQLNEIIDYTFNILKPYADNIDFISYGNHEAKSIKYNHFDALKQLTRELNRIRAKSLPDIQLGDYRGFLQMVFEPKYKLTSSGSKARSSKRDKENAPQLILYYNHGTGKGAEVTKGMINSNRVSTWINADIMISGHNHNAWIDETGRMIYVDKEGNLVDKHRTYINMPSYKKSLQPKEKENYNISFEDENFRTAPAHNGCGIMELDVDTGKKIIERKIWLKMNNKER